MVIGVMMGMLLFDNAALGLIFGVAIGMAMGRKQRKRKRRSASSRIPAGLTARRAALLPLA